MDDALSSLAWSPDGSRLAAGLLPSSSTTDRPDASELWLFDPTSLAPGTDAGAGGGPVFLP
jgi:hypothetical protein